MKQNNKEIEITIEGKPIKNFTKEEIDVYFKSSKPIRMIMEKAVQSKEKEMLDGEIKFLKSLDNIDKATWNLGNWNKILKRLQKLKGASNDK